MKPKVLFVYDHPTPAWWLDGLSAALDVLGDEFEIALWNNRDPECVKPLSVLEGAFDLILGWGAFGSPVDTALQQIHHTKKGLCIAGNALPPTGAENYDVLFYETNWIKENYLPYHRNAVHAFGVNTDIFSPSSINTPVVWDYIGVGAFAAWKRWEKMLEKKGTRLVIGEYQKNNESESLGIVQNLIRGGVMCSNMAHPLDLALLYHYSRTLFMPSDIMGGGERSVLEARSCGLAVEIEDDNPKLKELVEIEKIPSHHDYARALHDGILSVL